MSQAVEPGRLLSANEPLEKGDLVYIWDAAFTGWYKNRFSHARRILE